MRIVVAMRCSWGPCVAKTSWWTWTLWDEKGRAVARAEEVWSKRSTAQREARKFRQLIGRPDITIRTSEGPAEVKEKK